LRQLSVLSLASVTGVATTRGVAAQSGDDTDGDDTDGNTTDTDSDDTGGNSTDTDGDGNTTDTDSDTGETTSEPDDDSTTVCEGSPTMSRTSVTSPNSRITTDDPAVVEANFRPEPTIPGDCTIIVDLEFSFTDAGFQWGGGADWDQATSDLVVGTFEVSPGEIRDIRAELHTQGAEAGDQVTVVADYELWFKGNRENSVQQSGIRHTITVESPNPPEEEDNTVASLPGFGIGTALASLGGASYLLRRRLTGSKSSHDDA
jgi:PGF-CTERM protein